MNNSIFTPNARFEPWWWEAAPPLKANLEDLPARTDALVVGAGYTGLSAALTLARAGRDVLVLDSGDPGCGATSRNGGMVGSGHRLGFDTLEKRFGRNQAIAILKEGMASLDYTAALIGDEGISCDFSVSGRFRAAWRPEHYEALGREADLLGRLIGLESEMVPKSGQHLEVATDSYHGGCVFHRHGGLHPGLFHQGLLERAQAAGATVAGRTGVAGIERESGGIAVLTERGRIAARDVIIATNGYTGAASPYLRRRIVPVASYIVVTEPLEAKVVAALIPGGRMIVETGNRHCYYRPTPDGRHLMFGGRAALSDIGLRRSAEYLHRLIVQLFPQLEKVRIWRSWNGFLGFTLKELPHIGGGDHLYHALGFSGSGVAMAPYLGHKVALKVLGAGEGRTAFDDLPFPALPLYAGRPWFLPFLDLYYRAKNRFEGSSWKCRNKEP